MGGWAQLTISPVKQFNLNGGCGMDEPENDITSVQYKRNRSCWGSAFYTAWERVEFGFMYQHIRTDLTVVAGTTRSYQERIGNYYATSAKLMF